MTTLTITAGRVARVMVAIALVALGTMLMGLWVLVVILAAAWNDKWNTAGEGIQLSFVLIPAFVACFWGAAAVGRDRGPTEPPH